MFFTTDPLEVTWTFFTGFFGQEKGRGIEVDSWITEYSRLHNDKESRYCTYCLYDEHGDKRYCR